jgi:hypothetical protein
MKAIKNTFKEFLRYPSAIFGMVIIAILIVISVYALISLPYQLFQEKQITRDD